MNIAIIAMGRGIRERQRLLRIYGGTRWRKMKGDGRIRFASGDEAIAEIHWYEAHGIGRKEYKIKRVLQWQQ